MGFVTRGVVGVLGHGEQDRWSFEAMLRDVIILRMTGNSLGEGMIVPPNPSESSPKSMLTVQPLLTQGQGKGVEAGGPCI